MKNMKKIIIVTGGVISGVGKGIVAASLGRLLKNSGLKVTIQKFDPYLNLNAGTMNPVQHGECYVLNDSAETDLDLGHYERFISETLTKSSNVTAGQIYDSILKKEKRGDYLGATVQIIPHVTNEIKSRIKEVSESNDSDIAIVEIGGSVGDIESLPFLEAVRQLKIELGNDNVCYVHVGLIPYLEASKELKTKPMQVSVKQLQSLGIQPDILVCRVEKGNLTQEIKNKIALFCNVEVSNVIQCRNVDIIYEVPLVLSDEKLDERVKNKLNIKTSIPDHLRLKSIVDRMKKANKRTTIAIVGKYVELHDAYISIIESLRIAGGYSDAKVEIEFIDSEELTEFNIKDKLKNAKGVIVPGGFGSRGIEGMIITSKYCRENDIPYLGICLGMQIAAIDFARNVLNLSNANSEEFDDTENKIIHIMDEQKTITDKSGTMRLGEYKTILSEESKVFKFYNEKEILERHRHRYEFNNAYREDFIKNGMNIVGTSPDGKLVEIIEYSKNKFFVGVQFHPEFKSRITTPHPLFVNLIKATL